jgi:hypothetical protein
MDSAVSLLAWPPPARVSARKTTWPVGKVLSAGAALAKGASTSLDTKSPQKIAPSKARRKSAGQRAKALEYAGIHRISVFAGTGEASFNVTVYR